MGGKKYPDADTHQVGSPGNHADPALVEDGASSHPRDNWNPRPGCRGDSGTTEVAGLEGHQGTHENADNGLCTKNSKQSPVRPKEGATTILRTTFSREGISEI